tara:strand:- start:533 stop:1393 length:861 start_codon:yes stop_codon:yes gene_type:complete
MKTLIKEKSNLPFILTSPHSGSKFPRGFFKNNNLNESKRKLLMVSDLYVDELIENIKPYNLVKLLSQYSRAYIDLNRSVNEIDYTILNKKPKTYKNFIVSGYTKNGYGLIHTKTFDQKDIYKNPLSSNDINERISKIYEPWHQRLEKKIKKLRMQNNQVFLLDFHSMPSEVFNQSQFIKRDIILGDQYGKSSNIEFTTVLKNLFEKSGLNVGMNIPYKGGFISKNYGNPLKGVHAIQIEIRRDLYMNEKELTKKKEFEKFKSKLEVVIENYIKTFIEKNELEYAAQ